MRALPRRPNLALVGFMGTGKSSTGRLLASLLRYKFVDTDECIERQTGRKITEIFATDGEPAFRQMESDVVSSLATQERCVIATGGGLVLHPPNLDSLKTHALVVCLWASPDAIWERVRNQNHRPLLQDPNPKDKIRRLLEARTPAYRQADVLITTERRSIREVASQILSHYRPPARTPSATPTPPPA